MMNRARLAVGLQGVGIAERATQQALAYARERRQGRAPACRRRNRRRSSIIPTSSACCMTMRAQTQAARSICYATAIAIDHAERGTDEAARHAAHATRLAAHAGRQGVFDRYRRRGRFARRASARRHGLYRRNRRRAALSAMRGSPRSTKAPTASRRSTSSIRKLPLDGGAVVEPFLGELRAHRRGGERHQRPALGWSGLRLEEAVASLHARHAMDAGQTRTAPTRHSPAPRPICGCSPWPPAAACWRSRRWRRCGSMPTRPSPCARALFCRELAVQAPAP